MFPVCGSGARPYKNFVTYTPMDGQRRKKMSQCFPLNGTELGCGWSGCLLFWASGRNDLELDLGDTLEDVTVMSGFCLDWRLLMLGVRCCSEVRSPSQKPSGGSHVQNCWRGHTEIRTVASHNACPSLEAHCASSRDMGSLVTGIIKLAKCPA